MSQPKRAQGTERNPSSPERSQRAPKRKAPPVTEDDYSGPAMGRYNRQTEVLVRAPWHALARGNKRSCLGQETPGTEEKAGDTRHKPIVLSPSPGPASKTQTAIVTEEKHVSTFAKTKAGATIYNPIILSSSPERPPKAQAVLFEQPPTEKKVAGSFIDIMDCEAKRNPTMIRPPPTQRSSELPDRKISTGTKRTIDSFEAVLSREATRNVKYRQTLCPSIISTPPSTGDAPLRHSVLGDRIVRPHIPGNSRPSYDALRKDVDNFRMLSEIYGGTEAEINRKLKRPEVQQMLDHLRPNYIFKVHSWQEGVKTQDTEIKQEEITQKDGLEFEPQPFYPYGAYPQRLHDNTIPPWIQLPQRKVDVNFAQTKFDNDNGSLMNLLLPSGLGHDERTLKTEPSELKIDRKKIRRWVPDD